MRLSELIAPHKAIGISDPEIVGLTADSRLVGPGYIFAALPGVVADGRDYIESALEKGASAVLSLPNLPELPVPLFATDTPRREYAHIAARLYPRQPETNIAITGTNGKSSTVEFLRQIWDFAGFDAACFGTLGIATKAGLEPLSHTTPDAVDLHRTLNQLAQSGITHAAMEASSHGLKQYRLDGVHLAAVAFTNLTQDHLDYHPDFKDYFSSKTRLFTDLARKGLPAIINVDGTYGLQMADTAKEAGLNVISVGWGAHDIRIAEVTPQRAAQTLEIVWDGKPHTIELPLAGEFQSLNVVSALGLAVATGVDKQTALAAARQLTGVAGRMEKAGETAQGAPVFVDFAHTPDGLEKLLRGVRPHTMGRIIIVFGCGGDRDSRKRAKMGEAAEKLADYVIVTDDNPRSEDAALIRDAVMKGCPSAENVADRGVAIARGVELLQAQDCLVIAGKGHERGQIIGDTVIPFQDIQVARKALSMQGKRRAG